MQPCIDYIICNPLLRRTRWCRLIASNIAINRRQPRCRQSHHGVAVLFALARAAAWCSTVCDTWEGVTIRLQWMGVLAMAARGRSVGRAVVAIARASPFPLGAQDTAWCTRAAYSASGNASRPPGTRHSRTSDMLTSSLTSGLTIRHFQ